MDNLTIIDIIVLLIGVFLVTVFGVIPLAMAAFVTLRTLIAILIMPPVALYEYLRGNIR